MDLVAGVDSSTQSTKVELRDIETGDVVATGRAGHPPVYPPNSEQNPDSWWSSLLRAFAQVSDHLSDVRAISVVAQQHGLVCLDTNGAPLRKAKLWNDTTSSPQAEALVNRLGADAWASICGVVPVSSISITKLAWLVENEPDVVAAAGAFMLPHDFLIFKLTGQLVTDRGDASGTGWWSPVSERYELELLSLVVDDPQGVVDRLPRVLNPQELAGVVTDDAASLTGLVPGIPVGCGTGDNMGVAYALGLELGDIVMSLGTSGTVYAVTDRAITDGTGTVAGFADAAGGYLPLVATLNATRVTDTVALWLGAERDVLADIALSATPDPGLVLKPYFDGERTPNLPNAKGTFSGLSNEVTRGDIAAAAHIGVVCGLLHGIDALATCGVATSGQLHLVGGGARSAAYQQWVADLWGHPVAVHVDNESAAGGACRQAVVAATGSEASWKLHPNLFVDPRVNVDGGIYREEYERS